MQRNQLLGLSNQSKANHYILWVLASILTMITTTVFADTIALQDKLFAAYGLMY